jgi:hypothetical protein
MQAGENAREHGGFAARLPVSGSPEWTLVALFGQKPKDLPRTADLVPMNEQVSIGFSRRLVLAFAAVFAVLAVSGAWQAVSAHETVRLLIVLVAFGGISVVYAAQVIRRGPVLLLDDEGLTDARGGIVVRWNDVEAAHVAERRASFDRYHDLVLTVAREQRSLSLDQLTSKWSDVVDLVEDRLGKQVSVRREGGLISKQSRRRPLAGSPAAGRG